MFRQTYCAERLLKEVRKSGSVFIKFKINTKRQPTTPRIKCGLIRRGGKFKPLLYWRFFALHDEARFHTDLF